MTTTAAVNVETDASHSVLRVSGALCLANAAQALKQGENLLRDSTQVIDLTSLETADSAALAVLLAWSARIQSHGIKPIVRGMPADLLALAHLCEVETMLNLEAAG